jgi:TP901 family phage tail tape measure protein
MARTISDETMRFTLVIDGNEAQKELFDLEKGTRRLTEENKSLALQKKLLIRQGKQETDEYRALTRTMRENSETIRTNRLRTQELQNQLGLTGLTITQLTQKANILRSSLRNAIPGSEAYTRYNSELQQVSARINELNGRARNAGMSLGTLSDGFSRFHGMAISIIAGLTGIVLSIQKIIDVSGKLSDAQADVMKTTGMTKHEVDELTKSFGLLETRTSRINLLGIAEQGGRIGITKAEITDFVNVMNKASVALGDSFTGGVEEVSEKLGKIKFLFQETKEMSVDQAYNSIGSAINDLGANGVASERNIAEFTTRIGSLTDVLKPSIQETLALGTAFEESGIEAEVSARAYNIFMKQASTESAKFAKVMGLSQKSVENLIDTNPLDFMLQFAQGMKGMSATDTAKTLDYLGINADGANKVIGAMGNNMGRFKELIDLSNKSFSDGTSLVNEYTIKNNNLAATLEKISNSVTEWFTNETFVSWLTTSVEWIAKLIGATTEADSSTAAWKNTLVFTAKMVAIVTAAIITNVGWQKLVALWTTRNTEATLLYNLATKARAFSEGVAIVATQAYAIATMLLTGNIRGAAQAFRLMTATMMATPWGFIIGLLAAVGTAYVLFSKEVSDASIVQKTLSDVHLEASKNIAKQKNELDVYTKIAANSALTDDQRLKAIKKLNDLIPDHIGLLSLQNIKTAEGIDILKRYTDELYANARAKAAQSKFDQLAQERLDVEGKTSKDYQGSLTSFFDKFNGGSPEFKNRKDVENYVIKTFAKDLGARKDKVTGATMVDAKTFETLVKNYMDKYGITEKETELAQKDAQMKALENEVLKANVKDLDKTTPTTPKSGYVVPAADAKKGKRDPNSTQEELNRIRLENEAKYADQLLKQQRQLEDDRIAAMKDGYDKEVLLENQRYLREVDELEKQKVHIVELAKLDEDIAKAKKSKDVTKYNALLEIRKGWDEKNRALDAQIDALKETKLKIHYLKLGIIEEKGVKDKITKAKEAYDRDKIIRETEYNLELARLGNNQAAKDKLTRNFEKSELEHDEKFLKELLAQYNEIINDKEFQGIDIELLTPEQVTEFKKLSEEAQKALAVLIAQKKALSGSQAKEGAAALGLENAGQKDILGFTNDQWITFYDNLKSGTFGINEMSFALISLANAWGKYNEFLEANENANLQKFERSSDKKKQRLKSQLDSGMISQTTYNKKVEQIDKEIEAKKMDIEYKQAKRKKQMEIVNTIINTSVAIMQAYSQLGPIGGTIAAVLIGTMGALQLNAIRKQPLPAKGYEEGLYPDLVKRDQDGKIFKSQFGGNTRSGLIKNTSHFLVAENGPEMVIDNKAWTQMSPAVKEALINELRGIKGFEHGYYNDETKRIEVPESTTNNPNTSNLNSSPDVSAILQLMMNVVQENTAIMKDLRNNGVVATMNKKNLRDMKDIKEGISDYDSLKNKSKR